MTQVDYPYAESPFMEFAKYTLISSFIKWDQTQPMKKFL